MQGVPVDRSVLLLLQGKEIFYIPIYDQGNEDVVAGIAILQFKSINAYAVISSFDLLYKNIDNHIHHESPVENIIDNFIIPFFKNNIFKSNKVKVEMMNGLVKKNIPNFSSMILEELHQTVPGYNKKILITIAAHLIVCLELCPFRSLEGNLYPVDNSQWFNSLLFEKMVTIVMYVVLNLTLLIKE